jgi:hypothetical protein
MQINPVHALLALLRQQAQAQLLEKTSLKPLETLADLSAEAKETQFRLALIEKHVADLAMSRAQGGNGLEMAEATRTTPKFVASLLTSGSSTDAINQKQSYSHGRAWHYKAQLWQESAADNIRYQVVDSRPELLENISVLQKFTPTSVDIAEALFREGEEPEQFARMVFEKSRLADLDENQPGWPRLLTLCVGVLIIALVFKFIF